MLKIWNFRKKLACSRPTVNHGHRAEGLVETAQFLFSLHCPFKQMEHDSLSQFSFLSPLTPCTPTRRISQTLAPLTHSQDSTTQCVSHLSWRAPSFQAASKQLENNSKASQNCTHFWNSHGSSIQAREQFSRKFWSFHPPKRRAELFLQNFPGHARYLIRKLLACARWTVNLGYRAKGL